MVLACSKHLDSKQGEQSTLHCALTIAITCILHIVTEVCSTTILVTGRDYGETPALVTRGVFTSTRGNGIFIDRHPGSSGLSPPMANGCFSTPRCTTLATQQRLRKNPYPHSFEGGLYGREVHLQDQLLRAYASPISCHSSSVGPPYFVLCWTPLFRSLLNHLISFSFEPHYIVIWKQVSKVGHSPPYARPSNPSEQGGPFSTLCKTLKPK